MKINEGDLFRIKETGEILEITGVGKNACRFNCYKKDGSPDCGSDGSQHNIEYDIKTWYRNGGLEKIIYKTNWQEKYNQKRQHEMTPAEALEMLEWEHNLVQDLQISRDKRRKHRKPFKVTLEQAAEIVKSWRAHKQGI